MVRGSARIDLTTLSPNGSFVTRSGYMAPFSQIAECEEAEPGDRVDLRYMPLASNLRLITRPDGSSALDYDLTAEMTVLALRKMEYRVLEDAYSTAYEMEVQPCICRLEGQGHPQTLEKTVTEKLPTDCTAVRVQDICIRACSGTAVCGDRAFQADYYVKVLYETADGVICSAGKRISAELSASDDCDCSCIYTPCADGASGVVDPDGGITVSFRAVLTLTGGGGRDCRVISGCCLDTDRPKTAARRGSLVLRTVGEGENVWSIAKVYNTAPEDIRSANKLEQGAEPQPGCLLIIPFVG